MLKVKINCKKVLDDIKFPFCSKHDQTTEYVMEYGREKSKKQYQITEKIATERKVKVQRENKAMRYMQIRRLKKTREKRRRIQVKIGEEK